MADSVELPRIRVAEPTAGVAGGDGDGDYTGPARRPILGSWGSLSFSSKRKTKPAMPGTPGKGASSNANGGSATHDANGEVIVGELSSDDAPQNLWFPMISPQSPTT